MSIAHMSVILGCSRCVGLTVARLAPSGNSISWIITYIN